MKLLCQALFAAASLLFAAACSTQVDEFKVDAESFRALAIQAENRGDYLSAHLGYERVLSNARLANADFKVEARNLFHIARLAGYRGIYRKSVYQFRQTLELIEKNSPDSDVDYLKSKTYVELARLYHDTEHHDSAVPFFQLAVDSIEKQKEINLLPSTFQEFLTNYLDSLKESSSSEYRQKLKDASQSFQPGPSEFFDPLTYAQFLVELSHKLEAVNDDAFALSVSAEAQHIREQQTLANDPIAYADFLDEFAESLNATEEYDLALYVTNKAQTIRNKHPGQIAKEKTHQY